MPTPYIDVDTFKLFVDQRALAELGSDTDADGAVSDLNSILATAIEAASDEVRSYTLRGGMYTAADLDNLQTAGDGLLKRLVSDIAVGILIARRIGEIPDGVKMRLEAAGKTLEDLRDGRAVFGDIAARKSRASVPKAYVIPATQRANSRFVSDSPFFPTRGTTEV